MPLIKSKRFPHIEQYVPAETWNVMQENGLANRFRIEDDGDMQDTVKPTPQAFELPGVEPEEPKKMSRDELKEELTKMEVEFNPRSSTDKLYKLYIDNCK
jgi:hypothetical protein